MAENHCRSQIPITATTTRFSSYLYPVLFYFVLFERYRDLDGQYQKLVRYICHGSHTPCFKLWPLQISCPVQFKIPSNFTCGSAVYNGTLVCSFSNIL